MFFLRTFYGTQPPFLLPLYRCGLQTYNHGMCSSGLQAGLTSLNPVFGRSVMIQFPVRAPDAVSQFLLNNVLNVQINHIPHELVYITRSMF